MTNPTFNEYTPWAEGILDEEDENGPKVETDTTFTDARISNGMTAERLPYPTFNRLHNRADAQIQSILKNGISMDEDEIDVEILEGRMSSAKCTSHGLSAANRYNVGSATTCFSRIWPTRIAGVPKCLAIDCPATHSLTNSTLVYIVDRDLGTVATQDLVGGLDPGEDWHVKSICADGTYAYAAFINETDTSYWVQCYDMSDWSVRVGWPAYGVETTRNGGWAYPVDLIIADATSLAIHGFTPSATCIKLIDRATGVVSSTGNGDYTSGASQIMGLCSNGIYLFFGADEFLHSASIADLSVGCGGTNWPYTTSNTITRIACRGDFVAVCHGGTSAITEVARVQNAKYGTVTLSGTGYAHGVAFDDISLWIRSTRVVGATRRQDLAQMGLQVLLPENSSAAAAVTLTIASNITRVFDVDLVHPTAPESMDMRWDGRDLWIPGEATATATALNPYIFRYPHTRNNRGIVN